jgi:hypothetical protein
VFRLSGSPVGFSAATPMVRSKASTTSPKKPLAPPALKKPTARAALPAPQQPASKLAQRREPAPADAGADWESF